MKKGTLRIQINSGRLVKLSLRFLVDICLTPACFPCPPSAPLYYCSCPQKTTFPEASCLRVSGQIQPMAGDWQEGEEEKPGYFFPLSDSLCLCQWLLIGHWLHLCSGLSFPSLGDPLDSPFPKSSFPPTSLRSWAAGTITSSLILLSRGQGVRKGARVGGRRGRYLFLHFLF